MNYYTVYRDDEIVAFGNANQCIEKLQLKNIRQFYALISKARSGLRQHYNIVVEKVEEQETERYHLDHRCSKRTRI